MRTKLHHECFDEPWMIERSRAMNAEIDASPEPDKVKWEVLQRYRFAAMEEDPKKAEALGYLLEEGLMRAALIGHPTNGRWGLMDANVPTVRLPKFAYYDDVWMIERSRAMNAEMDALPEQNDFTLWAVFEKHRAAAEADHPEKAKVLGPGLDDGLRRAALHDHPTHGRWGPVGCAYGPCPDGLFTLLCILWQRKDAEFWKACAIPVGQGRGPAMISVFERYDAEEKRIRDQWNAEHPEQKKDA